jgi:DNA polymerase III sliding clamp (beta) subunit (PCNA family)
MELTTINSETLHTLVKGAIVGASKDKTLMGLNVVRVEIREPLVRVVSTDRYRLVIGDINMVEGTVMETGNFNLPLDSAKDLLKALPIKKDSGEVLIELSDDEKYVSFTCEGSAGKWSKEYLTLDSLFPKYESLIPQAFTSTEDICFNPAFMADIAKLPTAPSTPVRMKFTGNNKPMFGTLDGANGVSWSYLLMPVRLAG